MEKNVRYEIVPGAYLVSTRGSPRNRGAIRDEIERLAAKARGEEPSSAVKRPAGSQVEVRVRVLAELKKPAPSKRKAATRPGTTRRKAAVPTAPRKAPRRK